MAGWLVENLCHNHFERALHNGGAAAGLQTIPSLAAAATSQAWSAAAHAGTDLSNTVVSIYLASKTTG